MSSKIFWYASVSSGSPALSRFTVPVFSPADEDESSPLDDEESSSSPPHAAPKSVSAISTTNHRRNRMFVIPLGLVHPDCLCSIDPGSGVGIEEVQALRVDHQLDRLALAGTRARVEAGEHDGAPVLRLRLHVLERLLADVDRQLLHVVGQRLRRVDGEVDDDVGAERLAQLDHRVDAAI